MDEFGLIAYAFLSIVDILSAPVLLGLSIMDLGIVLTSVAMVNRFLLMPMFNRNAFAGFKTRKNEESKNSRNSNKED